MDGDLGAVEPPSSSGGSSMVGGDVFSPVGMENIHRLEAAVASLMFCSATVLMGGGISWFCENGEEVFSGGSLGSVLAW